MLYWLRDTQTAQRFQAIQEAYELLLAKMPPPPRSPPPPPPPPPPDEEEEDRDSRDEL